MAKDSVFSGFDIGRAIIQSIVSLGVGIWFIIAYAKYHDERCQTKIATFLLATGISQIVFLFISLIATFGCKIGVQGQDKKKAGCGSLCVTFIMCLFLLWMFIWWIVGQAWTFGISSSACFDTLYLTSFWYLICTYLLLGVGIIVIVIYFCYTMCCKKKKVSMSDYY